VNDGVVVVVVGVDGDMCIGVCGGDGGVAECIGDVCCGGGDMVYMMVVYMLVRLLSVLLLSSLVLIGVVGVCCVLAFHSVGVVATMYDGRADVGLACVGLC